MADRILVVEDEEAISELIEMNLTVAGYEVVQVYDGGKVEEVLEQEAGFDLALVDVMLPGRDGFSLMEVMKHLRYWSGPENRERRWNLRTSGLCLVSIRYTRQGRRSA